MKKKVYGVFLAFLILSSLILIFNFEPATATTNSDGAYTLVGTWGGINNPKGVAVSDSGYVYVTDSNNHCFKRFTVDGVPSGQSEFIRNPFGIAVDSSGLVYVANLYYDNLVPASVRVFDSNCIQLDKWFEGQLNLPYGVAVDGSRNLYVTDIGDQCVYKFSEGRGTVFGSGVQFNSPIGVAVDRNSSFVYIVDSSYVYKFSNTGELLKKWGGLGSGNGQFNLAAGIAVDILGNVYVTDFYNHRFQKFDCNGTFLDKSALGQVNSPRGIAVDTKGNVYVADESNNQNYKFKPNAPVVLVWGWHGDESTWNVMPGWLADSGYSVNIFQYNTQLKAEDSAQSLKQFVEKIRDPNNDGITEQDKVSIIAHSFGGLVSRYYIERLGGDKDVRNLIMLGTPNHGSPLANCLINYQTMAGWEIALNPNLVILAIVSRLAAIYWDPFCDSTRELQTGAHNSFLAILNDGFSSENVETSYFTIAGTGHLGIVSPIPGAILTSSILILPGHDDGAVQVESVRLPGVPLYAVSENHFQLTESKVGYGIIESILSGSALNPMLFPVSINPDSADSLALPNTNFFESSTMNAGESQQGDFDVSDNSMFWLESNHCDFKVTLTSPSGQTIMPENFSDVNGVDYVSSGHDWSYSIVNPETGLWHYKIDALEVPLGGTEVKIAAASLPVVWLTNHDSYNLLVNVVGQGIVGRNTSEPYIYNQAVNLTAVPSAGWVFAGWSGDLPGSTNPATLVMNANKSVTATFTQKIYSLTVTSVGGGSVVKNPEQASYHLGDTVVLTATPSDGWSFAGWSGSFSGSINPVSVIINGTTPITASFVQNTYSLIIASVGSGSVNLNKTVPYSFGDVVQLTAVPTASWGFSGWSGDLSGSANPSTIAINGNKSVAATFTQNTYTLTTIPVGGGFVSLNNTGPYHLGDHVRLTAVSQTGWAFAGWAGDLTGSSNPSIITIDANKSITPNFTQINYGLSISTSGSGSVVLNNTGPYHFGDVVSFTAVPTVGWRFSFWSGDLAGSTNPNYLTITANKSVTATFSHTDFSASISWVGSVNTDWNNPTNWNPNRLPNGSDDVYIPVNAQVVLSSGATTINRIDNHGYLTITNAQLNIAANSTMSWLTLNNAILGSTDIAVTSRLVWSTGTIKNCKITIGSNAVADFVGRHVYLSDDYAILDNASISNFGVTNWATSNLNIGATNGASFKNYGIFNILVTGSGGFGPAFTNYGTVSRSAAVGAISFGYFENYGLVDLDSGDILDLSGGGNSDGVFRVGFNSTLLFEGVQTLQAGSLVSGAGNITFYGNTIVRGDFAVTGAVTVSGSVEFDKTLTLTDVTVRGSLIFNNIDVSVNRLTTSGVVSGPANITITDRLVWSTGTIKNCKITIGSNAVADFVGRHVYLSDDYAILDNASISNFGVTNWATSNLNIGATNGASFKNYGAFYAFANSTGFAPAFTNFGTVFRLIGSGGVTFTSYFENDGLVQVASGDGLSLTGGGINSGTFNVGFNSTLYFSGTYILQAGSLVTGAGNVTFYGNTVVQGDFAVSGAVTVYSSASVRFNKTPSLGDVSVSGSLTFNSLNVSANSLSIGGTVAGPANITVLHKLVWSAGTIKNCRVTIASNAVADFVGTYYDGASLDNASISNFGVANWASGPGHNIGSVNGASFKNYGIFNILVTGSGGFGPDFTNYGTMSRPAAVGAVTFGYFENYGLVDLNSGDILDLSGGGNSTGQFRVGFNSTLVFEGLHILQAGSLVTGAGNVTFYGNTVVQGDFAVSGAVTVYSSASVRFNKTPSLGDVSVSGSLTFNSLNVSANSLSIGGTVAGPANINVTKLFLFGSEGKIQNCVVNLASGALGEIRGWDQSGVMFPDQHAPILDNCTFNNYGTINWDHDGWRGYIFPAFVKIGSLNGALFVNHAGAIFNIQPMYDTGDTATSTFDPVFKNYGTVNVTGSIDNRVFGSFENFGEIILWNGQLNFALFSNHGLLSIKSQGLVATNNYEQGSEAELNIDLGSVSPASGYGKLQVSTHATMDGSLNIVSNSGATPQLGDVFNIIYMPNRSGNFSVINGLNLLNGYALQPSFYNQGLSLTVLHPALTFSNIGGNSWYKINSTLVNSVVNGDVNGDGQKEIVSAGSYFDGTRNVAQLIVWNSSSMIPEKTTSWFWTGNTTINSVALGDVNGDGQIEIVTGGSYFDGTRNNAQLIVWNGTSLAVEKLTGWFWTGNTAIKSIALGDVDGDGHVEIATGGTYFDGVHANAQLIVWDGSSLSLKRVMCWQWTGDTVINSVIIGEVNGDGQIEIVTGGSYFDGVRNNAQLAVWNGANLVADKILGWYWTSNTVIDSVALGDVNSDGQIEVVTGGFYNDGTRNNAQLIVWNGAFLALEKITGWFWSSNTAINSVAIGDVNSDGQSEIVTAGQYNDGTRDVAQLAIWSGSSLAATQIRSWYWTSNTEINSATIGDINNDSSNEIVTGGSFHDGTRLNSQLTVWGMS